ncbi:ribosomal RNA small subunit methyltransferase A [Candidatus Uhrbacteria bacterium]|nr:ribosomal RNA small subunit methyltransferase A [Candidatus Uhrbacteria bacterium]
MTPKLKRHRGQHLLTDRNVLKKIVERANIKPTDTVVEIGAGTGNLTEYLARKAGRVIAIEIDKDLVPILTKRCSSYETVEILQDDARAFNPETYNLHPETYLVVANIPYNITSIIIRKFLEQGPQPSRMVLLIQKEVAERICARPPHMNILALSVQYFAHPKVLFDVSRNSFVPRPNVDSAVIEIVLHGKKGSGTNSLREIEPDPFFRLVTAGFAQKRKLLASNLAQGLGIPREKILDAFVAARIPASARAQELSLDEWHALASSLSPLPNASGGYIMKE